MLKKIFIITICLLLTGCGLYSEHTEKIKVNDKTTKYFGKGDSRYLISTDQGVFEDTDSIYFLKWNSADVYFYLKENNCYMIDYYWTRNQFLSWYPNIIRVKEIQC